MPRVASHEDNHDRQHPLAADPVTEGPEEEPTQRSHEERHREHGERAEQRGGAVRLREELTGDVGGEKAVDREVVPLDGVAYAGSEQCLT